MAKNRAFLAIFLRFLVRGDNFSRHNLSMQRSIKHLKTKGYKMNEYKNWLINKGYATVVNNLSITIIDIHINRIKNNSAHQFLGAF